MQTPDISVVVLAQADVRALERSLASAARQVLQPCRIYIIPSLSNAHVSADLKRLANRYNAQPMIAGNVNATPFAQCLNSQIVGDWISFLREGDAYFPAFLSVMSSLIHERSLLAVASAIVPETHASRQRRQASSSSDGSDGLIAAMRAATEGRRYTSLSTLVVNRSLLELGIGFPFEEAEEDDWTSIPRFILPLGIRAQLLPYRLVSHREPKILGLTEERILAQRRLLRMADEVSETPSTRELRQGLYGLISGDLPESNDEIDLLSAASRQTVGKWRGYTRKILLEKALRIAGERHDIDQASRLRLSLRAAQNELTQSHTQITNVSLETEAGLRADLFDAHRALDALRHRWPDVLMSRAKRRNRRSAEESVFDLSAPDVDGMSTVGFSDPEFWGRWIDGPLARIRLPTPRNWVAKTVIFGIHYVFPWVGEPGRVYVSQDGFGEHEVVFTANELFTFPLEENVGSIRITIRPEGFKQPKQEPIQEGRELSVGISFVKLSSY